MTFEDVVDAVLRPKNQSASGVLRCADLYCGDGEATRAALNSGMRVVYAYDPSEPVCEAYLERFGQEPFCGSIRDSVRLAPEFDLLIVRLSQKNQKKLAEHAGRFIRDRNPMGVLFVGEDPPIDLTDQIWGIISEMETLGYRTAVIFPSDDPNDNMMCAFIGVFGDRRFRFPAKMTLPELVVALRQAVLDCE